MTELEKRIAKAKAVMDSLPEWARRNCYWCGGENIRTKTKEMRS